MCPSPFFFFTNTNFGNLFAFFFSSSQKSTPHCSRVFFLSPCRASIVQKRIIYFQDEGPLTKRMCEKGRILYRHGMNNLLPVSYLFHLPAASLFHSLLLLSFFFMLFFFFFKPLFSFVHDLDAGTPVRFVFLRLVDDCK